MSIVPLTEAKTRLNDLVDSVVNTHERVTITRHGRPAVVVMSVDDYESMEETLYWQGVPDAIKDVQAARDEATRGELTSVDEVRAMFGIASK